MTRLRGELEALKSTHDFLNQRDQLSTLATRLDPQQTAKERDISNIDFEPQTSSERRKFNSEYVNRDLLSLNMSLLGSLEERRERLRTILYQFHVMTDLEQTIHGVDFSGAYILLRQAIPCILHCENRIGEKLLKLLLIDGFNHHNGSKKEQKEFIKGFEKLANSEVLGTMWRHSNWRVGVATDKDNNLKIGDQPMPNRNARKFVDNFEKLTEFCIHDLEIRAQWDAMIVPYRKAICLARQKEDFTDEEIDLFQDLCDDFFIKILDLKGRDGMTNYIHMLGSGHMSYYLKDGGIFTDSRSKGGKVLMPKSRISFSDVRNGVVTAVSHMSGIPR